MTTVDRLKALLRETLELRMPAELRERITAALERGPGGPGRSRTLDYDKIRKLHAGGKSATAIAEKLGVTRQAISKILNASVPTE